jgi:hypothetical protein
LPPQRARARRSTGATVTRENRSVSAHFQVSRRKSLLARSTPTLPQLMHTVLATDLRYTKPQKVLRFGVVGFNDEVGIGNSYRVGWDDVSWGFTPYDWEAFEP